MQKNDQKTLIAEYKQKARTKYKRLVASRKKRRALPLRERFELHKKDRQSDARWHARIKKLPAGSERTAQKKGYKLYKKLQRRPYVIGVWSAILAVIIILMSVWYYGATRPLTDEQTAARDHSLAVAREVMGEGMVLLRNEQHTLPLQTHTVSVFGTSAASPVFGGGGAGGISSKDATSLFTALDAAGIAYHKGLYNVYNNFVFNKKASTNEYQPKKSTSLLDTLLPNVAGFLAGAVDEMPLDKLPAEVRDDAAHYSDTALYVIARVGTETQDLTPEALTLSDDERATLDYLDATYKHIVVLLNTTNAVETGFVETYKHIDSALWIGAPGEVGMYAVADALTGAINPSGKLTDTYAYDASSNPAIKNIGDFQYTKDGQPAGRYFTNYLENIYVGYRYYETFVDADAYDSVVQYPFGYGLSYTTFDWKVASSHANADTVSADVTVTNTGDVAGKDVVQLYYKAPFTQGGIEKSAIALGGYAKTKLLQPGESQTVTVTFTTDSMASYDDKAAKAWVLDAGAYTLQIGRDVHTPVATFAYQQPTQKVMHRDETTGAEVTNRFDDARGDLTYFSRSNSAVTYPVAPAGDAFTLPQAVADGDYVHEVVDVAEPTTKAKNNIKLADMKGLAYDDPKWQQFLDQFSDKELVKLAGDGGYWTTEFARLGIPRTSMYDGPASIRSFLQAWATVAYPIPVNLSATWNTSLAEKVGAAMGAEAQSFDVDAVYAPSLNLHRSPLGGRNFEYFSEDPLVAGTFGAAWAKGLQSTKTIAVMKHFAANDQETNCANYGLYTWMTEQSLRELYFKPFEITVKQSDVHGVMSAFNRIGATWAGGSKPLLTDVLRGEWGFNGFVITDAGVGPQGEYFDALQAVEAGNDLMLGFVLNTPNDNAFEGQLKTYLKEDRAGTLTALRKAAHNICYYVLQTSKME